MLSIVSNWDITLKFCNIIHLCSGHGEGGVDAEHGDEAAEAELDARLAEVEEDHDHQQRHRQPPRQVPALFLIRDWCGLLSLSVLSEKFRNNVHKFLRRLLSSILYLLVESEVL